MMTESEYYYNKSSQDRIYGDLQHESIMTVLNETENLNLISILKPKLSVDGNQWVFLYGENLHDGVAGFGDTPRLAAIDFNKNFNNQKLP